MATDAVEQAVSPIWDTELAWDVDAKVLGFLRSQRVALKLIVYTIDSLKRRDALGYIMLDLRSASANASGGEKWMHLVNTKISGPYKPELKIAFSVVYKGDLAREGVKETIVSTISKTIESPSSPIKGAPLIKFFEQLGYYQIGNGIDMWALWLTIAFAENLAIMTDIQNEESNQASSFYFYYSFLGNDITTRKFQRLSSPDFPAERVSIKLVGAENDIGFFFKDSGKLNVYLCQDTKAIGFTQVNLSELLSHTGPLKVVENVYPLLNQEQVIIQSEDGTRPVIGVSMALKKIDQEHQNLPIHIEETTEAPFLNSEVHDSENPKTTELPEKNIEMKNQQHLGNAQNSTVRWHQYRFSIDIRTIRDFKLQSANVYFKYNYAPFGSTSPCITHPTLPVTNTDYEKIIPNSFYAFEFVMPFERLSTYIEAVPLVIEVWSRDDNAKDTPLGICTINLAPVLMQAPRIVKDDKMINVYSLDGFYLVTASGHDDEVSKKVADVRVVLALEDFGLIEEEYVESHPHKIASDPEKSDRISQKASKNLDFATQQSEILLPIPVAQPKTSGEANPQKKAENVLHQVFSKNALELELDQFRQEEEKKFREKLHQREGEHLSNLVNECKKKEKERDFVSKKKIDELNELESQFQKLILDLESRERKLDQGEEDLLKRRQDLEREFDRRIDEARDATRRLQEEFKHKIEIEKRKTADVESQRVRISKEREEWESRFRDLDQSFADYKRGLGVTSEAQLRAELNITIQSRAELESRVNNLVQSKKHYKSEWIKAVANLSRLKKEYQVEQELAQTKERREIQRLKAQFLAKEELEVLDSDRQAIQSLRRDLDVLRYTSGDNQKSPSNKLDLDNKSKKENLDPSRVKEIDRLSKERDSLLKSGVYSNDDRLIRELNLRISNLIT